MPFGSRRVPLGLAAIALVAALCAGCSKEPTFPSDESTLPQTQLTFAPMEMDTALVRVHLYWNGFDSDGQVVRFRYAVDTDTMRPPGLWNATTAKDTLLVFPVDPVSEVGFHSFQVAAEDNDGRIDPTPATRMFSTRTLPPTSRIVSGPAAHNPVVPPTFTFNWSGIDPDGSTTGGRAAVDSFQYLLLRPGMAANIGAHDPLPPWNQNEYLTMIRAALGDGLPASSDGVTRRFDGWKWVGVRGLRHRFENLAPGEYVFAERAVDIAGAREKDLAFVRNIHHFTVGNRAVGPLLVVRSSLSNLPLNGVGPIAIIGGFLQVFEGETVSFSWTASAESYGGEIAGYTYALDDPGAFPPLDLRLTGATFQPSDLPVGPHILFVRALDDAEQETNVAIQILVVHPTLKDPGAPRAILFVDDSSVQLGNGSGPTDVTETDWWTLGPGGNGPLFSLGVPYMEWDTLERGSGEGRKAPTLRDLAPFTTVVWTTDATNGGSNKTALFMTVADDGYSDLQGYLRAGGTLILTGWNLAQNTSGVGNLTYKTGGIAPNGMCATFAPGSRERDLTIFPRMYMGIDNSIPSTAGLRSQGAFDFVRGVPTPAGAALGFDTARVDTGNLSFGVQYPSDDPGAITFKWNTNEYPPPTTSPDQRLFPGVAGIEAWIMASEFGCQPIQNFGLENPGQPVVQPIYTYHGVPRGVLQDGSPSPREGFACASFVQSHDLGTNAGRYVPTAAVGRIALFTFPLYYLRDTDAVEILKKSFAYVNGSPTLP
jgi:hypothetical protein